MDCIHTSQNNFDLQAGVHNRSLLNTFGCVRVHACMCVFQFVALVSILGSP